MTQEPLFARHVLELKRLPENGNADAEIINSRVEGQASFTNTRKDASSSGDSDNDESEASGVGSMGSYVFLQQLFPLSAFLTSIHAVSGVLYS